MTGRRVAMLAGAVALLAGCRSEPVTWRVPMHDVLLLHDTLSWGQLVPDTLWEEGEEGLRLHIQATRTLFDADALVPTLDTAWTDAFSLPFTGGPIPVAPGTPLWQEEEQVPFNIPEVGLRRVRLGGGVLRLRVSSTVQGPLAVRYALEGAEFPPETNGGSPDIELTVEADTVEVSLDLAGVVLDLDGPDGLQFGKLATSWSIGVPDNAAEPVGVFGSDQLALTVELAGLEVAQVEGQFDTQALTVADTLVLDALAGLQELELGWTGMDIDLTVRNTTGLDLNTTLNAVDRIDSAEGLADSMPLEDAAIGSPVWLARAGLAGQGGMDTWQLTPTEADFAFSSDAGNLAAFLASVPDALAWDVTLEVNPLGDVSGGFDRVDLTRLPEVDLEVTAPLSLSASRAVWVDTLDLVPPEWLDYAGFLNLEAESTLPVGATLKLELVDLPESLTLFGTVFGPYWWIFDELVVWPGSGDPNAPVAVTTSVDFMQPHFEALRLGARLRVEVELETPEGEADFRADQRVVLRGLLNGDAQISIE